MSNLESPGGRQPGTGCQVKGETNRVYLEIALFFTLYTNSVKN